MVAQRNHRAIHHKRHAREQRHAKPGGRHHHVGVQMLPGCQHNPCTVKPRDLIGNDGRASFPKGDEQVSVGYHAEPLVPWLVAWREVLIEGEIVT